MQKGFTILVLAFFAFSFPKISSAQQTVGLFAKNTGEQDGYVLFYPNNVDTTYLIDKCGKLVHKWNTDYLPGADSYVLPNGDLLSTGTLANPYFGSAGTDGGIIQIFDWNGNLLWRYTISDSVNQQDHDVYPMPNGDILVDVWERFTAQQAAAMGRDTAKLGNVPIYSAKVEELKPIGTDSAQVVWQWRLWDHLIQDHDPSKPNYGMVADHPELFNINYYDTTEKPLGVSDWIHLNAVTYNRDLDQVMISSRSMSEIYIIDHSATTAEAASHSGGKHGKGGDFLYRWGNPAAYNRGTPADKRLFVQHNPFWIPYGYPGAGNISVFDDGTSRPNGQSYSSADIIKPPVDSAGDYYLASGGTYGPDSAYWSYTAPKPTDFYSTYQGGVQVMPNGNVLVCEAEKGNFFEVDSNKNIVWRYVNPCGSTGPVTQGKVPLKNTVFRAYFYPESYPAFKNITLKPGNPVERHPYPSNCSMPYVLYTKPLYNISQIKAYDLVTGVSDSLNAGTGFIKGVVESPNLGINNTQFSLIDSTGAISVTTNNSSYAPSIGDSVLVGGTVTQSNGLTEYSVDTIITKPKGTWLKQPNVVAQLDESNESNLIRIDSVWLVDTSEWYSQYPGFDVHITNGKDTFIMYINYRTNLYTMKAPFEAFNVTGVEIQDKPSLPYFGDYEIEPRGSFDIERVAQLYQIRQVRIQNQVTGIADSAGSPNNFFLKGIVQSPDFGSAGLDFSIKDSTGSIIIVSAADIDGYKPTIGDSIELRGVLTQVNGLTEVIADSISLLNNHGSVAINSSTVSDLAEPTEATLIKLDAVRLIDTSQWIPTGNGFVVDIANGTDTFDMYISSGSDLFKMNALQGSFNVTGIEIQDQPDSPYFGNYEIEPRGFFDIQRYTPLYTVRQVRPQDPITGTSDSAGSIHPFFLKGIVQSPDLDSSGLDFSLRDSTASIIVVSDTDVSEYMPAIGDSIELRGLLTQVEGLTEVSVDSISFLGNTSAAINPLSISSLNETAEATLVKLNGYRFVDTGQWISKTNSFNINITNGTDTFAMYIGNNTDLYKIKAPDEEFDVTGIEIQDKTSAPFFGNYEIAPRGSFDIQRVIQHYTIGQVRAQDSVTGIADSAGSLNSFFLKGIVQSPDFKTQGYDFSLMDSTGSIFVAALAEINNYAPTVGDSVEVRGLLVQTDGVINVEIDSISQLSPSSKALAPKTVTSLGETTEANLVEYKNAWLVNPAQWTPSGTGFSADITNGIDTITLYVSSSTDVFSKPAPIGKFNVIGIGSQDKPSAPYLGDYLLMPRDFADFSFLPVPLYKIRQVKGYDPVSGIADSINTFCFLKGVVQSGNLSGNKTESYALQDTTDAITLRSDAIANSYTPIVGDSIEAQGKVLQLNGLTYFLVDSTSKLSSGEQITPIIATVLDESTESKLVTLSGYTLIDTSQWDTTGANGSFKVLATNMIDTIPLDIVSGTGTDFYSNSAKPIGIFDVTGIGSQNDPIEPYLSGYYLIPRGIFDFSTNSSIEPGNPAHGNITIYPNPATDAIYIKSPLSITGVQITDMLGKTIYAKTSGTANNRTVDISSLKQGVYLVRVYTGSDFEIAKIVKE